MVKLYQNIKKSKCLNVFNYYLPQFKLSALIFSINFHARAARSCHTMAWVRARSYHTIAWVRGRSYHTMAWVRARSYHTMALVRDI